MVSEITPEDVESRSFGHSLRGYDPGEVRTYLDSLADHLRRLQGQYLVARQQLGVLESEEVAAQIDNATTDINEVLQAARISAEQMRDRAAVDAANMTNDASAVASEAMQRSADDAYALRQSAWDTSSEMLEQVRAEYSRLRQQADRDSLAIVGEAERDAHKKLATARRDSETKIRSARLEAERLLVDARAERDNLINLAERSTEAAQERTRALERRREELMDELEELRLQREAPPDPVHRGESSSVRIVPGGDPSGTEVRSRAPVPRPAPPAEWIEEDEVRVVAAPVQHAPWADGSETVRLVASPVQPDEDVEIDAEALAGEVARLRSAAEQTQHEEDAEARSGGEATTPSPQPIVEGASPDRDLAKAWSSSKTHLSPAGDDLGSLFHELRVNEAEQPEPSPSVTGHAVEPALDVSENTPLEELFPREIVTPFELRDRALLPITNRALRDVKRQIADVQNMQLEALKGDPSHWQPNRAELESPLTQELMVVQREAYTAGYGAAHHMLNRDLEPGRVDAPDGESRPFISALFDEVVLTVQSGREADHGARELGAAVSRVYRVWRTDEAERRMRHLASGAYHKGLLQAFADVKVTDVQIEVHGSCVECTAVAAGGIAVADGDTIPIHDECRCTIVPA